MKKLFCIPLLLASGFALCADISQLDNIGATVYEVREFPFKQPPVTATASKTIEEVPMVNLAFTDALQHILVPTGIKHNEKSSAILLGDRFYIEGDVITVEILKDAQNYDSAAENVSISTITDKEVVVIVGDPQNAKSVSIDLPSPTKIKSTPSSISNDFGKITFLRHEIPVKLPATNDNHNTPLKKSK